MASNLSVLLSLRRSAEEDALKALGKAAAARLRAEEEQRQLDSVAEQARQALQQETRRRAAASAPRVAADGLQRERYRQRLTAALARAEKSAAITGRACSTRPGSPNKRLLRVSARPDRSALPLRSCGHAKPPTETSKPSAGPRTQSVTGCTVRIPDAAEAREGGGEASSSPQRARRTQRSESKEGFGRDRPPFLLSDPALWPLCSLW